MTDGLKAFVADADLLVQDALSLRIVRAMEQAAAGTRMARIAKDIQDYHASLGSLSALTGPGGARHLALYHLVPPPQNILFEQIYRTDMPEGAILTRDRMTFVLPANSDVVEW